jgi:hypothetical protein
MSTVRNSSRAGQVTLTDRDDLERSSQVPDVSQV